MSVLRGSTLRDSILLGSVLRGSIIRGVSPLPPAPSWNPSALTGAQDYWDWKIRASLKQPDQTTAVTAYGDPTGLWAGQLGNINLARDDTPSAPIYTALGLQFASGAGVKNLEASLSARAETLPFTLAESFYLPTAGNVATFLQGGGDYIHGWYLFDSVSQMSVSGRDTTTNLSPLSAGFHRVIITRGAGGASCWIDGVKSALLIGGPTYRSTNSLIMTAYDPAVPFYRRRAALTHADVSDEDAALLDTWLSEG